MKAIAPCSTTAEHDTTCNIIPSMRCWHRLTLTGSVFRLKSPLKAHSDVMSVMVIVLLVVVVLYVSSTAYDTIYHSFVGKLLRLNNSFGRVVRHKGGVFVTHGI